MSVTNIFDGETLETYIKASAMFILIYEHFEDLVIETVKDSFSIQTIIDGKMTSTLDPKYIKTLGEKIRAGEECIIPYWWQKKNAEKAIDRYECAVKIGKYKEEKNKNEDGKIFRGSLDWLATQGLFDEPEKARILEIRKRRNEIVHGLFQIVYEGMPDSDAYMIADLMEYHRRINNWAAQSDCDFPKGCDPDQAVGIDDLILKTMIDIMFVGKSDEYKDALSQNGIKVE